MASLPGKKRAVGARAVVAVIAFAVIAAACGGGGGSSKATKQEAPTTTTNPKVVPVAPLTGLPDPKDVARSRSAVTVKINNTNAATQVGVDKADVVYEEVVEGGITRLAAIFNSQAPDKVGPVRSVRKTDQSIVWPIGGIFAYSGGAQYAVDSINTAPVKQLDETRAGSMMYRDPVGYQYMPYNLWAHVDQMYKAGGKPVPPPAIFVYRKPKAKVGGTPVGAFTVGFQAGFASTWTWDATSNTWIRTPGSSAAKVADPNGNDVKIAPKNVVVMFVQYIGGAGVIQSEANLVGTGDAWIFTGGKVIKGHWTRPDKEKPAKLTDAKGGIVRLAAGQTWVELPDTSYTVTVLPPAPAASTNK
jgi:hypothetical protein